MQILSREVYGVLLFYGCSALPLAGPGRATSSDLGSSHTRSTSSTVDSEEFNEKHRSPLVRERCHMEPAIVSIASFIQYNHLVFFLWPPVLVGVISLITTHSKHLRRTPSVPHLISYYKKPDASGRGFRISFPSSIYPKRSKLVAAYLSFRRKSIIWGSCLAGCCQCSWWTTVHLRVRCRGGKCASSICLWFIVSSVWHFYS